MQFLKNTEYKNNDWLKVNYYQSIKGSVVDSNSNNTLYYRNLRAKCSLSSVVLRWGRRRGIAGFRANR